MNPVGFAVLRREAFPINGLDELLESIGRRNFYNPSGTRKSLACNFKKRFFQIFKQFILMILFQQAQKNLDGLLFQLAGCTLFLFWLRDMATRHSIRMDFPEKLSGGTLRAL